MQKLLDARKLLPRIQIYGCLHMEGTLRPISGQETTGRGCKLISDQDGESHDEHKFDSRLMG